MARKWSDLRAEFDETPEHLAIVAAHRADAVRELVEYNLAELRKALDITQAELANRLDIPQSNVSRIENQDDVLISTLARYVAGLGGELLITVRFGDNTATAVAGEQAGEGVVLNLLDALNRSARESSNAGQRGGGEVRSLRRPAVKKRPTHVEQKPRKKVAAKKAPVRRVAKTAAKKPTVKRAPR